jgi:hypothetical protein
MLSQRTRPTHEVVPSALVQRNSPSTIEIPTTTGIEKLHSGMYCAPCKKTKTYNRRDSQMVTHSSTSRPVQCLCMAERTGCPVFTDLWSYVMILLFRYNLIFSFTREKKAKWNWTTRTFHEVTKPESTSSRFHEFCTG